MTSAWRRSPQEVDPLSWFTGPSIPLVLAGVAVVQGVVITLIYWNSWSIVALEWAAMPLFLAAGWVAAQFAQPHRRRFGWRQAALVLAIATVGLALAAGGTVNSTLPVAQWWPGIGLAAILASLAPYSSARRMVVYSIPTIVIAAVVGSLVFTSLSRFWPPVGIVVISTGPVLVAAVASVVFSYSVVERTTAWLETSAGDEEVYPVSRYLDDTELASSITRVSVRVAPFLEGVANAGMITPADRTLAAQIARTLRAELVTASNRSWLDTLASESGMVVSDPARLADGMDESQRTALRGLLVAAVESSVVDQQSILIELRKQPDGSTAVALSIDVDLPEGRRLMLLAPYYLTLKTTVDDLSWASGESVKLKFRIPPS
jgi:hypothetical protein